MSNAELNEAFEEIPLVDQQNKAVHAYSKLFCQFVGKF